MDGERDLAADLHFCVRKRFQSVHDPAVGGVFDRHDAEIALISLDFLKNPGNRRNGCEIRADAEEFERRLMRETEKGTEKRDLFRFDECVAQ